jgi:hypothetical protein
LAPAARERLESELGHCEQGRTGIPGHFAQNERTCGYGCGIGLIAMGLACLLYKPNRSADASLDDAQMR